MEKSTVEILLIEDNMDDVALTLRALKKSGLSNVIHHLKDGAEALDYFYNEEKKEGKELTDKPKLILLDLKMPKVSGLEVLAKIKSDPNLKTIPVVILTSSKEDPDIKKSYDLGANSYIVKPVESEVFFQAIKKLGMYWVILNQPPN